MQLERGKPSVYSINHCKVSIYAYESVVTVFTGYNPLTNGYRYVDGNFICCLQTIL